MVFYIVYEGRVRHKHKYEHWLWHWHWAAYEDVDGNMRVEWNVMSWNATVWVSTGRVLGNAFGCDRNEGFRGPAEIDAL
jgi:hypothetical protein